MAGSAFLASQFVAAGLFLLLAVALLVVKFNSRVNRAFAIYLMLEGLAILLLNVSRLQGETDPADLWSRLTYYPLVVMPLALAHFLVAYRRPSGGPGLRTASLIAAGAGVGLVVVHATVTCSFQCLTEAGDLQAGFLLAFAGLKPLLQALVALVLAIDVLRGSAGLRSTAVALVALAFGLLATFDSGLGVSLFLTGSVLQFYENGVWIWANRFLQVPAFVMALAALGVLFRVAPWGQTARSARYAIVGLAAAVFLSILRIATAPDTDGYQFGTFLGGFWRTLMPAVVAYALVRHRLFDIDLKIRSSVAFALVAATFGGTYFLVSEGLEAVVSSRFGTLGGLAAAALLTLLAKPITAVARRISTVLVPGIHGLSEPDLPAASIYRAQFLLFSEDGALTAKERRLLEHLREHLGVAPGEAAKIEKGAVAAPATRNRRAGSLPIK